MKFEKYDDITPSNRTNFATVYYHACRSLKRLETQLIQAYGAENYKKYNLRRVQKKLEQTVARYKYLTTELKAEISLRKQK